MSLSWLKSGGIPLVPQRLVITLASLTLLFVVLLLLLLLWGVGSAEYLCIMSNLESSLDGLNRNCWLVLEYLFDAEVAGDHNALVLELDLVSFGFTLA